MIFDEDNEATFFVVDTDGAPVPSTVHLTFRVLGRAMQEHRETDSEGGVVFALPDMSIPEYVACFPHTPGYWSIRTSEIEDFENFTLEPLPSFEAPAWWQRCLGNACGDPDRGRGIRVGVIDREFLPGPGLERMTICDLKGDPCDCDPLTRAWGHGEAVARILGDADPSARHITAAPGAQMLCVDVADEHGRIMPDLAAAAIIALAAKGAVDILNLSWGYFPEQETDEGGAPAPPDFSGLGDAIYVAAQMGVLTVAAAGNDPPGEGMAYPASLPECVAVGAVGLCGWGAPGTVCQWFDGESRRPRGHGAREDTGEIFAWCDSAYGNDLDVAAPGVGIVFFRDGKPAFEVSGTSFAAPMISGMVAVALGADETYLAMPRDFSRTEYARARLIELCASAGLDRRFEGDGIPNLRLR